MRWEHLSTPYLLYWYTLDIFDPCHPWSREGNLILFFPFSHSLFALVPTCIGRAEHLWRTLWQSLKNFITITLGESTTQEIGMAVDMATSLTNTINQVLVHQEGATTRTTIELIDKTLKTMDKTSFPILSTLLS